MNSVPDVYFPSVSLSSDENMSDSKIPKKRLKFDDDEKENVNLKDVLNTNGNQLWRKQARRSNILRNNSNIFVEERSSNVERPVEHFAAKRRYSVDEFISENSPCTNVAVEKKIRVNDEQSASEISVFNNRDTTDNRSGHNSDDSKMKNFHFGECEYNKIKVPSNENQFLERKNTKKFRSYVPIGVALEESSDSELRVARTDISEDQLSCDSWVVLHEPSFPISTPCSSSSFDERPVVCDTVS